MIPSRNPKRASKATDRIFAQAAGSHFGAHVNFWSADVTTSTGYSAPRLREGILDPPYLVGNEAGTSPDQRFVADSFRLWAEG
jgi:hypothetical protein